MNAICTYGLSLNCVYLYLRQTCHYICDRDSFMCKEITIVYTNTIHSYVERLIKRVNSLCCDSDFSI